MYKRIYKLIDGEKNAKMVKSGGKDRGSNQRFTDTRVYWKLEAENGRTKWERQREDERRGRERERRAGPPNESPEKRRRWEY